MSFQSEEGAAGAEDSLTSTEFDRFLAERAAAADNLPTISKEEKSLVGEVNDAHPEEYFGPIASSEASGSSLRRRVVEKKPEKQEESLIEF